MYSDLYLDGNDLGCQGVISLIGKIADECESVALRKEQEELEKRQAEEKRLAEEAAKPEWERALANATTTPNQTDNDENNKAEGGEKKKKKKKRVLQHLDFIK